MINKMDRDSLNSAVSESIIKAMRAGHWFTDVHVERLAMMYGYDRFGQQDKLRSNLVRDLRKAGYRAENRGTFIRVYTE